MIETTEKHRQAMDLAEAAFLARRRGDAERASQLLVRAFHLEREAAQTLASDLSAEPTRSVLYRSAATLALDCGERAEAGRLIDAAFAGHPPEPIASELRELRDRAHASTASVRAEAA